LNLLQPKLGFATIVSPYEVGADRAAASQKKATHILENEGLIVSPFNRLIDSEKTASEAAYYLNQHNVDAVCLLYGTYADDTYATTTIEGLRLPAVIWGTNDFDTGSTPGAQQVSEVLTEMGFNYKLVLGDLDDFDAVHQVKILARAAAVKKRLFNCRLGVIGYPRIKGQTQASFDEVELRIRLGARIVGVGMDLLKTLMVEIEEEDALKIWRRVSEGAGKISVNREQLMDAVKAYLATKRIVQEKELNAITIEDWNELIGIPNLAFSLLNEEGIPAGCEGDVHATLTLYLLYLLTGRPAFHGELLGVLKEQDALLVGHYGAGAPSLAPSKQEISLEPDRSPMGRGVSVVFQIRHGPVTIASLTGRRGSYRMMIAPGESISAPEVFHGGIVANVRFRTNHRQVIDQANGMSHHWMLGIGDVSEELVEYCEMSGIKPVRIGF